MPFPILTEADLPPSGTSCERTDLDFKRTAPPDACVEHAKDVAALASTIAGQSLLAQRQGEPSSNHIPAYLLRLRQSCRTPTSRAHSSSAGFWAVKVRF